MFSERLFFPSNFTFRAILWFFDDDEVQHQAER